MRSNDRASYGPRAMRLGTSIPAVGCRNGCEATAGQANREANTVGPRATPRSQRLCGLWLGSSQLTGLKPFFDYCGVALSGETAAGIDSLAPARLALTGLPAANLPKPLPQLRVAQRSRLQPSLWGRGAEKHAEGMIPHPDGGRHSFSAEKCRSKIINCSSAAFMGFHQRLPR
jgi:hypothetical protein